MLILEVPDEPGGKFGDSSRYKQGLAGNGQPLLILAGAIPLKPETPRDLGVPARRVWCYLNFIKPKLFLWLLANHKSTTCLVEID